MWFLAQVDISMENIEKVVRERNRAYYELETGTTGERPGKVVYSKLGLTTWFKWVNQFITFHYVETKMLIQNTNLHFVSLHRERQHFIPKYANAKLRDGFFTYSRRENEPFLKLYREKIWNEKRKTKKYGDCLEHHVIIHSITSNTISLFHFTAVIAMKSPTFSVGSRMSATICWRRNSQTSTWRKFCATTKREDILHRKYERTGFMFPYRKLEINK